MRHVLMDQASDGTGRTGTGGTPDVTQAREFLTNFAPNADIVTNLPDGDVLAWHGNVKQQLTAAQQKAIESHDWRGAIAGDNADAKKTLERFASPKALYESYDQFRTKLSKGELRAVQAFPDKGSDDEKAAWRQQNGVPVSADKYEFKPAEGVVIGDNDKPTLEALAKHAHEKNIPAGQLNEVVNWYLSERVAREQRAHDQFETSKRETAAALGAEWGHEYKPMLNKIQGMIDATIPEGEEGQALKGLIGNALASNPMFARHYAQLALQINPTSTMVPGGAGAQEGSVTDELKKLDTLMRQNRPAYDKGEGGGRQRYEALVGQYANLTGKNWTP